MTRTTLAAIALTAALPSSVLAGGRLLSESDAQRYFSQERSQQVIREGLIRAERHWPLIRPSASRHGIPESLFFGLALCESAFNPRARSRAGAEGMFQFMPSTGRLYGLHDRSHWFDVGRSAEAAARHLRDLHERFGSWDLALAAYNGGPSRVQGAVRRARTTNWVHVRRHLPSETCSFVPKVRYLAQTYYPGFALSAADTDLFRIRVRRGDTYWSIARRYGVSADELQRINGARLLANTTVRVPVRTYRVRRGDTAWSISKRFGCSLNAMKILNTLPDDWHVQVGQVLVIP